VHRYSPRPNHADRVQWRPWGAAAFEEARQQGKPLALFITAFWCGFCQRMDETSLSNDEVIALLNAFFIPVRLEESQRPDVDLRYNQNGWPTIAFLAPSGGHLASVNYTPPDEFTGLLVRLVDYCRKNADAFAATVTPAVNAAEPPPPLTAAVVEEIAGMLEGLADAEFGGFGGDLKLLHPEATDFLLHRYAVTGERWCLDHAVLTLDQLHASPTFDRKDGGFFRYSSRRDWREPHPEKLLADQAALLRNYLRAYLVGGNERHRDVAGAIIDYLNGPLSEPMLAPFFAGCQDYVRDEAGELRSYLDTYVYCDANALAASALFDAWWLLGREDCRDRALAVTEAIWRDLRAPDGGMYHYRDDAPRVPGLLTDLVATGQLLLDAYASVGEASYLEGASALADHLLARYRNGDGGFHDTSETGPGNLAYPLTLLTQNAAASAFLRRLADLGGDEERRRWALWALQPFAAAHRQHGAFAAGLGDALARLLAPPVQLILSGRPGAADTLALLGAAHNGLRCANLVLRCRPEPGPASVELRAGDRSLGVFGDPAALRPDLVAGVQGDLDR
jgi:uncharacterized protein YyaL (SSP411 family)